MFITLGLITFLLLLPLSHQPLFEEVKRYLFQFYLLNLAVFLYSLYLSRFAYSALFALFLLINFTQIASTGNLFTDTAVRDDHHITLSHSAEKPLDVNAYGMAILRSGHLNLTPEVQSQFVTFEKIITFLPLSALILTVCPATFASKLSDSCKICLDAG